MLKLLGALVLVGSCSHVDFKVPYKQIGGVLQFRMEGVVDAELKDHVLKNIHRAEVDPHTTDIEIIINSPGGSVAEGVSIASAIRNSTKPVRCIVDGNASSTAYFIFESCRTRVMRPHSFLLVHRASIETRINAMEALAVAQFLHRLDVAMSIGNCARLSISYEDCTSRYANGDWVMNAGEALEVNATDLIEL